MHSISRRTLLKGGLSAATAGIVTPSLSDASTVEASPLSSAEAEAVMSTLASYMKDAQTRALPAEAAEHTKRHILDTFAAIVSGSALPPGKAALDLVRAYGPITGANATTVIASAMLAGPIEAALANAMMAHADETDDSHAPSQSHPGCSVVPAALATCERFATDGARFLNAVALGYDVGARMNMTLGVSSFEVGNHQSSHAFGGIWGSCGRRLRDGIVAETATVAARVRG